MKKYIFSLLATAFSLSALAQDYDEFGVVPQTLTAGSVGTITLTLNNPSMDNMHSMQNAVKVHMSVSTCPKLNVFVGHYVIQ